LSESKRLAEQVAALPWPDLYEALDAEGVATVTGLLSASECASLVSLYDDAERFRNTVVMSRHGYGSGEYRYFGYPLPPLVATLREAVYPRLVPLANRWHEALGSAVRFPEDHAAFVERCHAAGQLRPTPLLLRYQAGDYNRLHQDLYGEHVFPLQLAILLSEPGHDFEGGELVLTEHRARMQSRALVLTPQRGDAVVFAVRDRPVPSKRGHARAQMRHGVSTIKRGQRHTLGVIFHDAT
jgi:uncharacterized protein